MNHYPTTLPCLPFSSHPRAWLMLPLGRACTHKTLHQQFSAFSVKLCLLFLQEFSPRYFFFPDNTYSIWGKAKLCNKKLCDYKNWKKNIEAQFGKIIEQKTSLNIKIKISKSQCYLNRASLAPTPQSSSINIIKQRSWGAGSDGKERSKFKSLTPAWRVELLTCHPRVEGGRNRKVPGACWSARIDRASDLGRDYASKIKCRNNWES